MGMGFEGDSSVIKVSLSQFYGIEINDFAVSVAKTALWIAESQMMEATQEILMSVLDFLPLKSNSSIVEGNALRMDWNGVLRASDCSYVVGNPPFLGHQDMSSEQHREMDEVLANCKKHGKLDYVAGWYAKAKDYISDNDINVAFVSTNSITQGEQVSILWDYLFDEGIRINFAYRTFVWNSEALDKAHVHCVIIGFSNHDAMLKTIYSHDAQEHPRQINGYLYPGSLVSVASRQKNINPALAAKKLVKGSQPTDGGNLLFSKEEGDAFLERYPELADVIRKYVGADEFINGKYRYCLWLKDVPKERYENNPEIMGRLAAVRRLRECSPTASVRRDADKPELFTQIRQPDSDYLLFPRHSSGTREYLPIGFVSSNIIASDAASFIPNADLYLFGVLSSRMHNAWMRVVCGRLKSDYRYSPAVYNSFAFPDASSEDIEIINELASAVLSARANHNGATLGELYDPAYMPEDLRFAHAALDQAVERAYGEDFGGSEERMVSHLFSLYSKALSK